MIKINRDNYPPNDTYKLGRNIGISKWKIVENKVILDFKTNSLSFINGDYEFPKHPSYNSWKNELKSIQGRKCCFCEKPIQNGVIEHFRPKKGWQQETSSPIVRPGYFWLAYRWKNLLLCCTECNESGQKGNLFPIYRTGHRATTMSCKLENEKAYLINPYEENPAKFISYFKSEPISLHSRGAKTISILKLKDRADIKEIRKDQFDLYSLALELLKLEKFNIISKEKIDEAKKRIKTKINGKQPFSGMILENLKNGGFEDSTI